MISTGITWIGGNKSSIDRSIVILDGGLYGDKVLQVGE